MTNRLKLVVALLACGATAAPAQAREFRLDAGHSDIGFSIGFLGSKVRGRFDGLRGTITYDERQTSASSITIVIEAASLNSGSRHRDEHLKSSDFFDVATYPTITFQSSSVTRQGAGLVVRGPLTMHGVTKEVAIPFRALHAPAADPHGSTLIDFAGSVRLARADFQIMGGAKYNEWFDQLRSATMADSADITLEVSGWDTDFGRAKNAAVDSAVAHIERDGVAAVVARARAAVVKNPVAFKDGEWDVDQIGRALIQRGMVKDALAIFALEAEFFPKSATAHTAFGAGLEATGDKTAARAQYERALELDPRETRALERMRRLVK